MATVSDITTTPLSGLNHIDALVDSGPDWNYLTTAGGAPVYAINYTFSIASGNEVAQSGDQLPYSGGLQAFSATQQATVRSALAYITQLTGIQFVETAVGTDAQVHLAYANLLQSNVTGLCSWHSSYSYSGTSLKTYDADAYVYLDNVEWGAQNNNLAPGGKGYETLLHELGHALGLKHSFETTGDNKAVLPSSQDNTSNTLMSYTDVGGPYTTYRQDDVAALNWLYGGDGLRGALGMNATGGRYITGTNGADTLMGTAADDTFEGDGGNDMIYGGSGTDTAVFRGVRNDYTFANLANGDLQVTNKAGSTANDGVDTLSSIEILRFADASVARAAVVDTTAPSVPSLAVTKNANGYAAGDTPVVTGATEAGASVKIYTSTNILVGSATADATGLFTAFNDGMNYQVYATATDGAGNVSVASPMIAFNVDAHAPAIPTASVSYNQGSNLATFTGTGEAGTTIQLVHTGALIEIAEAKVGADGKWSVTTSPLPNGGYPVIAVAVDAAENSTSSGVTLNFSVSSPNNIDGTDGNDMLAAAVGGNAINGGAGVDTAVYAGARANYTVAKEVWGFGVTDKAGNGGHDALIDVERVQFADGFVALDIGGSAGEVFRLYQAAFGRPAESAGLGYWLWGKDQGLSLADMSKQFMTGQPEFDALYGTNPTNNEFVNHLYANVLHRAAEGAGYDYWMGVLDTNSATRAQVLTFFSESPENQAQVIGSIQNGIAYTPWVTA
jgi:serralysin